MTFLNSLNTAELPILDWIRENLGCAFLDAVMPVLTFLGNGGWFCIATAVVMLFFRRTRKTALMTGMALILGLLICNIILKPTVARIRPYDVKGNIDSLLIAAQHDFSFPSGHTTAFFEMATVFMIRDRRFGIPALVMAFIIAFSRMYLYVHYPTDILGGIVVGTLCGVLGYLIVGKLWHMIGEKKGFADELK